MEEVYSRTWLIGEKIKFREYKKGSSRIQEENEHRSKMTREIGYSRRKRL